MKVIEEGVYQKSVTYDVPKNTPSGIIIKKKVNQNNRRSGPEIHRPPQKNLFLEGQFW
jgi:hypothetical protein